MTSPNTTITTPLFEVDYKDAKVANVAYDYPVVKPLGTGYGIIDVVNTYCWRNMQSNNLTIIEEIPSIFLTEYKLTKGKWLENISGIWNYLDAVGTKKEGVEEALDPYQKLYTGSDETGFVYNLPYFVDSGYTVFGGIVNTWKEADLSEIPIIGNQAGRIANITSLMTPGFGYESPSFFGHTSKKSIIISFPLYNTIDLQNTKKNFYLCQLLQLQNVKVKMGLLTHIPPSVYKVEGLNFDGIYMPAAIVSNLDIKSIGTTRAVDIGEKKACLIPEAYKIQITLQSLIQDSTNILCGSFSEKNRVNLLNSR
jgi:hypothetical protein